MKINSINPTPKFGMRLTRELEQGFENAKEEIKDFCGKDSEKYKEYCAHLNIVKEHSNDYVVGIGYSEDVYNPYYFKMRHKDEDTEYFAGSYTAQKKDGLYTFMALKNLALTAIAQEWSDEKALKEAIEPKKPGLFRRLREKFSSNK